VTFRGVESVNAERPEGMVAYALTEWDAPAPLRRFVFANWNEDDDATLEVTARGVGWSVVGKSVTPA
jgi:hypothetical protein